VYISVYARATILVYGEYVDARLYMDRSVTIEAVDRKSGWNVHGGEAAIKIPREGLHYLHVFVPHGICPSQTPRSFEQELPFIVDVLPGALRLN